MNLDSLRTFLLLMERKSFSEVAKVLKVSQPAVSFQVQKLERDLGVRLIDRRQRGVVFTEAGKRVLRFASVVEKERSHIVDDLAHLREEVTGQLAIGASTIPAEFLLPAILSQFKEEHPGAELRLLVSDSATVIKGVVEGTYDVGFCGVVPADKELQSFKVAEDEIVLIAFPEHPFAQRERVSLLDIAEEPLIFREEGSGTRRSLEQLLSEVCGQPSQFRPKLTLGSTQSVVSAVEAKVGIAFVSNLAIRRSVALGLVKMVPLQSSALRRDFFCVYRKGLMVSRLHQEFLAFMRACHTGQCDVD
ncbi:MAG: selenium metabolism-associated LysR family transcriptional regulator [Chloroflexota bacterium]